jgi:hypothetical protein
LIPPPVRVALERVVSLLVAGDLKEIERLDAGHRTRADEWQARLQAYGRTLALPPPSDFETADVAPLHGQESTAWSVWYRLWTREEGKSDLGVELTVRYSGGDDVQIEVDDLRVA